MHHGLTQPPPPRNEAVLDHAPGSTERRELGAALTGLATTRVEIPLVIGGERVHTGDLGACRVPHDHRLELGSWHRADASHVERAVQAARSARARWSRVSWEARAAIFLRAAELLTTRYRATVNAGAMLSLSKTAHQAEIDAVCELADFWRFNVHDMTRIYRNQPHSPPGTWNSMDWRPLEGFVFAVTPFNFASIAGNLPTAPALMGNTVLWKPASSAVYPAWTIMQVLEDAGLPPGVINFVPGPGSTVGTPALQHPELAGLHFTGSTATLQAMWRLIADGIDSKLTWPRVVGETGGKDFVIAHTSADPAALVTALIRGAFEYQGQKCSAASRAYIPRSLWPRVREQLVDEVATLRMGDIGDFGNFMGAVIDERAFRTIGTYLDHARTSTSCTVLAGGGADDSVGWFVEPTVVLTSDPHDRLMEEEIFGPVLTVYVYPDDQWIETLKLCDRTSPYALTGAVFARDRYAIEEATDRLRDAAGNFYINDKPTGAVVGQQPFGGARASGTNDKAGSLLNLLRWVSPRTIKEQLHAPRDYRYPFMAT